MNDPIQPERGVDYNRLFDALEEAVELPPSAQQAIFQVLTAFARGNSVSVYEGEQEVTVGRARSILGIEHAKLTLLLNENLLPHREFHGVTYLPLGTVLAYKDILLRRISYDLRR